jgi:transcriptional regulator with XRE-family HTH domain
MKSQLNLPPALLTNSSQEQDARTNSSREPAARTNCSEEAERLAALFFDEGLREAKDLAGAPAPISSKEVASLLGVSESMVNRWRSTNYREGPSFTQMLRLPLSFHLALHRAMNRRFGFGRHALRRVLDAVGDLALAIE